MKVTLQILALVGLALVSLGIVLLVNAPKWFEIRSTPTTQTR